MTNDNTRTKANAVFFSVLMVISMVGVGFAAAPVAANADDPDVRPNVDGPTKQVDTSQPSSNNQTVVFQGETIERSGNLSNIQTLEGVSGDAEGQVIDLTSEIPTDQTEGTYSTNGSTIDPANDVYGFTILRPRISTAELQFGPDIDNVDDVSTVDVDSANNSTNVFQAFAEFNFEDAESVEVTVEDASGTDITGQVLAEGEDAIIENDSGSVGLDMTDEDAGEYTLVYEGTTDLDYGSVVQEYSFELTDQDEVAIELDSDSVTQGNNLEYTVTGGTNAEQHVVAISSDDFRDAGFDGDDFQRIFRNVGDTERVGVVTNDPSQLNASDPASDENISSIDYAFAIVEIDGTQAVGSIDTAFLDDTSVDIDVFNASDAVGTDDQAIVDNNDLVSVDDTEFEVVEGDITIDSPGDTYVAGADVDVNGTAETADEVAVYARDNGDWLPVTVGDSDGDDEFITVDSDDTYEEEDAVLSLSGNNGGQGGNQILAFAGSYSIGVIDAADAREVTTSSDKSITTSEFSSASSSRRVINVVEGDLTADFATINGQIAQEADGEIDVNGTAAGQDDVVVAFVDSRGGTEAITASVDSDNTFDEEDIDISTLAQGTVSAHVISLGRDGVVGNGDNASIGQDGVEVSDLESYIVGLGGSGGSGDQIRSRIVANTVEADGSDDLMVSQTFRLNDATLGINDVYPEGAQAEGVNPVATGDTLVAAGNTNRQADNAAITIELLDENDDSVLTGSTDEWGTDGQWSATLSTSDLETGTYTLEADDGESTDRVTVEIVESVEEETEEEETEEETTEEETTEEETTEEETTEETTEEETTEEETTEEETEEEATDDSTPGFGALVALVALVAAALLATRRRDE